MLTICLRILLVIFPITVFSQSSYTDNLRQELATARQDSTRYRIYRDLGFYYRTSNLDSALYFDNIAIDIARKNNQKIDEAQSLDEKGYVLMSANRIAEALQCTLEALTIASDPENEKMPWTKGAASTKPGPRSERLVLLATIHHHLGHLSGKVNNYEEQKHYYLETIRLVQESLDTSSLIGFPYMNLGRVYSIEDKLDSALLLEKKAEAIFIEKNERRYIPNVYRNMMTIYVKKGDTTKALDYLYNSIPICLETENFITLSNVYTQLTIYHIDNRNADSGLYYALKDLALLKSINSKALGDVYYHLYETYRLLNNKDSMLKYQGLSFDFTDSTRAEWIKNVSDFQTLTYNEQQRLQDLEKEKSEARTKNRIIALIGGLGVLLIVGIILYRNNLQKQKTNRKLEKTLQDLKATQTQLVQSEKMASLGELTAGIAHEIQNPLNFVNNFAEVNVELLDELKAPGGNSEVVIEEIRQNMERIALHGKRADSIVKNMLQHSRSSAGVKELTDVNGLCEEYLRLSYHGFRARDPNFNAHVKTEFDHSLGKINVIPQEIGRVLLNLFNNAFYAVHEKAIASNNAGMGNYEPTVMVSTKMKGSLAEIIIKDNGNGIPPKVLDKIFQPFFTTKPTGQGTGLGLSLSYDIIKKGHQGEIKVRTESGEMTEFVIELPVR